MNSILSIKTMDKYTDECRLKKKKKGVLSGKTGSSGIVPNYPTPTAWFIGDYKTDKDEYYFAVRIYGSKNVSGQRAKEIAIKICEEL